MLLKYLQIISTSTSTDTTTTATTTSKPNQPCPNVPESDSTCSTQCAEDEYCYKDECMKLQRCPCVLGGVVHEVT